MRPAPPLQGSLCIPGPAPRRWPRPAPAREDGGAGRWGGGVGRPLSGSRFLKGISQQFYFYIFFFSTVRTGLLIFPPVRKPSVKRQQKLHFPVAVQSTDLPTTTQPHNPQPSPVRGHCSSSGVSFRSAVWQVQCPWPVRGSQGCPWSRSFPPAPFLRFHTQAELWFDTKIIQPCQVI